jgi:hypothetical protein
MSKREQVDQRMATAFEVCRADRCDPADSECAYLASRLAADPKLSALHDCLQRVDAKIAAAFQDVPVPDGLEERLLQRLAAEKSVPRLSRRGLLLGGGLSAAAAAMLLAFLRGFRQPERLSEQYVLDEAIRRFNGDDTGDRTLLADRPPPGRYPFSQAVVLPPKTTWRVVEGLLGLGLQGIAYDLPLADGDKAVLYVTNCPVKTLSDSPALQPFTTGGCSASAWQENGLVYILVVQGDPSAYRRALRLPTGPIA